MLLVFRRLLLPALLSALVIPPIADWLNNASPTWPSWSFYGFGLLFTAGGILIVGLPVARMVARLRPGPLLALPPLLLAGAFGGAVIAIIAIMVISGQAQMAFHGGHLGLLPGAITALIWFAFNTDFYPARRKN